MKGEITETMNKMKTLAQEMKAFLKEIHTFISSLKEVFSIPT